MHTPGSPSGGARRPRATADPACLSPLQHRHYYEEADPDRCAALLRGSSGL